MGLQEIKNSLSMLSDIYRLALQKELELLSDSNSIIPRGQESRRNILDNKLGCCAHCGHTKYVNFGIDKGSQRYKCKSCKGSFTEYTGGLGWLDCSQRIRLMII